jgi:hypothetical protein
VSIAAVIVAAPATSARRWLRLVGSSRVSRRRPAISTIRAAKAGTANVRRQSMLVSRPPKTRPKVNPLAAVAV